MEDRLTADGLCRLCAISGIAFDESRSALEAGRQTSGTAEEKVIAWARGHPSAGAIESAQRTVSSWTGWIIALIALLGLIAGAGAGQTVLSVDALISPSVDPDGGWSAGPLASVNIFRALGALLGLQTLVLLVWLVLMVVRPRSGSVSVLGEGAKSLVEWCSARFGADAGLAARQAAVDSHMTMLWRGAPGRWALSGISHGFWLAFNIGLLVVVLVLLSTRSYRFHWETTILDEPTYAKITETISVVPDALGFATPSPEIVAASRMDAPTGGATANGAPPAMLAGPADSAAADEAAEPALAAASAWSGLLVGGLVSYGLLPRALLMLLSVGMLRRRRNQLRLDLSQPGYQRLLDRMMPEAEAGPIVDGESSGELAFVAATEHPAARGRATADGPPAIIGLEIVPPKTGWPPIVHGVRWLDLGLVEDGGSRNAALRALRDADPGPHATIVIGDLTTTPDRGLLAFVRRVVEAAPGRVAVVLTGGERLRERGDLAGLEQRVDDWRAMTAHAGLAAEDVLEVDLDHLTEPSAQRLRGVALRNGAPQSGSGHAPDERIDRAFTLIGQTFLDRAAPLDDRRLVELQKKIAGIYEAGRGAAAFRLNADALRAVRQPAELQQWVVEHGRGLLDRLPARLRAHPRWAAAGAVAGVTGCVAAGLLATPVAFASLPWWGVIGGAMGQLVRMAATGHESGADADSAQIERRLDELRTQLRAAALHAMLLHLQGGWGESAITRILDDAIPDSDDAPDPDEEAPASFADPDLSDWLEGLRNRFLAAVDRHAATSPDEEATS